MSKQYDAIVIGGGSGGLAFAKRAADLGARTCLIERDTLGGTCVNRGCVPKKLLWEAAWRRVRSGVAAPASVPSEPQFAELQSRIEAKISTIQGSFASEFDRDALDLIIGNATLIGPDAVRVDGQDYRAGAIVLATGAKPTRPDFEGASLTETSDDVLKWTSVPTSMVIMGGGYIGCEFAAIFRAFGCDVTLIDTGDRLLDTFDPDLSAAVEAVFSDRGIHVVLGREPARVTETGAGLAVCLDDGEIFEAERIVAATGRAPATSVVGDAGPDLKLADSGAFAVDEGLQTSVLGVYAIGDCADRLPLTPVATRDGERLAERLFGDTLPDLIDLKLVASAAFVMPPVAQIGTLDDGKTDTGQDLGETVIAPEGHWSTRTVTKTNTQNGTLSGVALMDPAAPDLIAGLGALIAGSAQAVTGVHPSFAEEVVGRD